MAVLEDGRILWANEAFCRFIRYTPVELCGNDTHPGLRWGDVLAKDGDADADVAQAAACMSGEAPEYRMRRRYVPKLDAPVLCELHVKRFPSVGEFQCFLVTVLPVRSGEELVYHAAMLKVDELKMQVADTHAMTVGAMTTAQAQMQASLDRLVDAITKRTDLEVAASGFVRWASQYPKATGVALLVLLVLLLGPRVVEAIKAIALLVPVGH